MAKQGIIPSHLQNTPTPACAACLYGRATRRLWRHATPKNKHTTKQITAPGQQISVDMLTSPTPGFVAQMTGLPTKKRYRILVATVIYTYRKHKMLTNLLKPRQHLSNMHFNMTSTFHLIMPTVTFSEQINGSKIASESIRNLTLPESTPIIKMDMLNVVLDRYKN